MTSIASENDILQVDLHGNVNVAKLVREDEIGDLGGGLSRAEVEQIAADAAAQAGGGLPVQRLTLTADTALDTSAWPTEQVVALVVVQDATGGHTLTLDGKDVAVAAEGATVTAWVHDGTTWTWRSSAGAGAVKPPVWATGTTVSLGTPTDTSVPVKFSKPIPAGAVVQWRAGAADSWRTLTMDSETTATIDGLAPSTAYAAPQFRLVSAGGESSILTATAFTTAQPAPQWRTIFHDSFTDPDGTLLGEHTPDVGEPWTDMIFPLSATIIDNAIQMTHVPAYGPWPTVDAQTAISPGTRTTRTTVEYAGLVAMHLRLVLGGNKDSTVYLIQHKDSAVQFQLLASYDPFPVTYTNGIDLLPVAGTLALETTDTSATLTIDGVKWREWDLSTKGGWTQRGVTALRMQLSGEDTGDAVGSKSKQIIRDVRVEALK